LELLKRLAVNRSDQKRIPNSTADRREAFHSMVDFEDEKQKASRVQWEDVDVEAGNRPRHSLHRSNSNISIYSMHSRRGSIDPASVLPIQYRTISFQIADSKEKNAAEIQKAKDNAAKGISSRDNIDHYNTDIPQSSRVLTGTSSVPTKFTLDSPVPRPKDCQQTKSNVESQNTAKISLHHHQLITSNRYSDTSSKALALSSLSAPYLCGYHGSLSASLPQ
jgi:hypothetical protein